MKKSEFLQYVENFLKEEEMKPSLFGRKALERPNFVFELRQGGEAREITQEKVFAFVEQYKKTH